MLVALAGGLDFEWDRNPDWPAFKSETMFGGLPMMYHNNVKLCQSLAIVHYLSRLAGCLDFFPSFSNSSVLLFSLDAITSSRRQ